MGPASESDGARERRREQQRLAARRRRWLALGGAAAAVALAVGLVVASGSGEKGHSDSGGSARQALHATAAEQDAARERILGYTEFIRQGRPVRDVVALTFDDGPGPYTSQIIRILKQHHARATFFATGIGLEGDPALAREMVRDGHSVGAHTYHHPRMGQLARTAQLDELNSVSALLQAERIESDPIFRPPYGSFNADTVDLLARRKWLMVLWSVDTGDYLNPGSDLIAERALDGARPGAVILLHDAGGDRTQTVAALPTILEGLRKRGLRTVTIPDLLVGNPPSRQQTLEDAMAVRPPGEVFETAPAPAPEAETAPAPEATAP